MTFAGILIPALLMSAAIRRWVAPLPWSIAGLALALTLAFLHGAVFTGSVPVPVGEVMRGYPWHGVVGEVHPRNPLTNDTVKQILPWMQVVREELAAGRAPLWNRYQFSGYPLLGNGQSAPFSPFFLATLFVPLPSQIVAMAGLKIFTAFVFTWLFLRDETLSRSAALFGAVVFAFSVFQTVYLYYPMTAVTALMPAAVFATRRCARTGDRAAMVLLALVTAAIMAGGHPESAVHVAIGCGVALLLEWRNPSRAIIAALAGVALSTPAWAPVAEQALVSVRAAALAATPHAAMNPLSLWTLLNPDGFGNPSRGNWQWIYNYSMVAPTYVGLLTLALVGCVRKRRDGAMLIAILALFLVAMDWTAFGRAANAVPPMRLIAQDRLRFVALFFAAVLASRVLDRFPRWTIAACGAVVTAAAVWLLHAKWHVTLDWHSTAGAIALGAFTLAAIVSPRMATAIAVAGAIGELFAFNAGFNALESRAYYEPPMPILTRMKELSRGEPSRIVGHDWTLLPNAAAQYGLEDVRGHDPMALASYARFFDRIAANDPSSDVKRVQNVEHPDLRFLGVRFLLTDPSFTPSDAWMLRYEGPDGKLFEARHWMRRFFAPNGDARIGRIAEDGPSTIRVEIDAPKPALIASSQVFARGWVVQGATETLRLHDTFIGFRVPTGTHTVTLRYRPITFYGGCLVSIVTLVLAVLALRRVE